MNTHTAKAANSGPRYRGMSIGFPPRRCQYIAGEASADDGCKCGRPIEPDSSYCARHAVVCRKAESEVT